MIRPHCRVPYRAALFFLLLLQPIHSDLAHASSGLAGWIKLLASSPGPAVDINEPVVWDENAHRLLYPDGSTLWSLVPGQAWTSQHITGTPPDLMTGDCAIFDPAGNRVLRFGGLRSGSAGNDVWELSLGSAPAWRKLFPAGFAPLGRTFGSMIVDAPGQRVIIFGGRDWSGTRFNDVYALSLAGSGTWTQLIANGASGSPSARDSHSAIFDPVRRRMVVFGGRDASGNLNDVWALSLGGLMPAWQSIPTTGAPSPRQGHAAIYDAVNDRMVIHGGSDIVQGPHNDTAALPFTGPAQWSVLPSCTIATYSDNAVFVTGQMLITNGSDTYALDLGSSPQWSFVERHMMGRAQTSAALAADTRTLVVFGGHNGNINFGDAWTLDLSSPGASWVRLNPASGPSPAWKAPMIWDPPRARFLTFAVDQNGIAGLWALTLGPPPTWKQVPTGGMTLPTVVEWHCIYDPNGDRLVFLSLEQLYVGLGVFALRNKIFELPLSGPNALQWAQHDVFPSQFDGRQGASFSYDAGRDAAWIFGGADSAGVAIGDVWRVDLAGTPSAAPVVTSGFPPAPRSDHAAMFDAARDRLLILGGRSGSVTYNTFVYELDAGAGNVWNLLSTRGGGGVLPSPRAYMASVYDEAAERLVIFGGSNSSTTFGDAWSLLVGLTTLPVEEAGAASIALAPLGGNPMKADLAMSVSLPSAGRGSLALLDVSGRRVRSVALDGLAAGTHSVALAKRGEIPPGLYFAVLRHVSGERRLKVVVLP